MERSTDLPRCPECGKPLGSAGCPSCAKKPRGIELKVLRGDAGELPASLSDVRLVRQVKLPTVDRLTADASETLERLPGQVDAMEEALGSGDLEAANRLMDEAMGSLLEGPGYRAAPARPPVVLWVWCGILLLLAVLAFWLLNG